jgi:hypothetical protein
MSHRENKPMRRGRGVVTTLVSLSLVLAAILACSGYEDADPSEVCNEAGYSIANRTLVCTNDAELGNARYRMLFDQYTCVAQQPPPPVDPGQDQPPGLTFEQQLQCAQTLFGLSCDQVNALGDNIGGWLASNSMCAIIFASKLPDGGLGDAAVCPSGTGDCLHNNTCIELASTTYCGACDNDCSKLGLPFGPNMQYGCLGATCSTSCVQNFGECNGDVTDGCETDLASSLVHCGVCNHPCATGQTCQGGTCL